MSNLLLQNINLPGTGVVDIAIRGGLIAEIGAALAVGDHESFDGTGCIVIPGLVDAHAHIDKTLWGLPWHPHQAGPTLLDKITYERATLARLKLSPEEQSGKLVRRMVACGTTHVRTHTDVAPDIGLAHIHGVQRMRENYRDAIDVQIVAFPQTGLLTKPGTLELLDEAIHDGAEVIGGIDPMGLEHDPKGHLDALFEIADRRGCGIDIHLHDGGLLGAVTVEMIIERTRTLGLKGKVAISHAFCLGMLDPGRFDSIAQGLVEQDIAIMTHAPSGTGAFPPVRELHARGVRLFTGSDGVRDTWSPLNNGDMLERAYLITYKNGFRDDSGIELALAMATTMSAQVMGAPNYGLSVGCDADLVVVEAECVPEAVVYHPVRKLVLKRGKVVARDGAFTLGRLAPVE